MRGLTREWGRAAAAGRSPDPRSSLSGLCKQTLARLTPAPPIPGLDEWPICSSLSSSYARAAGFRESPRSP
jgi:hypothetical protein